MRTGQTVLLTEGRRWSICLPLLLQSFKHAFWVVCGLTIILSGYHQIQTTKKKKKRQFRILMWPETIIFFYGLRWKGFQCTGFENAALWGTDLCLWLFTYWVWWHNMSVWGLLVNWYDGRYQSYHNSRMLIGSKDHRRSVKHTLDEDFRSWTTFCSSQFLRANFVINVSMCKVCLHWHLSVNLQSAKESNMTMLAKYKTSKISTYSRNQSSHSTTQIN